MQEEYKEGIQGFREAVDFLRQNNKASGLDWSDGLAEACRDHVLDVGLTDSA